MLLKDLGAAVRRRGHDRRRRRRRQEPARELGVQPQIVDGSGLSRADRTTPRQVVHLLEAHARPGDRGRLRGLAPVAGRTGTIRKRMRGTAAQDRCRAKTGTLIGVSALAGCARSAGGHTVAFAMLMNRPSSHPRPWRAGPVAAAIARYDGA